MIDSENKFVFIHIPRCAGTCVEHVLNPSFNDEWDEHVQLHKQHATALEVKQHYLCNGEFDDYFKFTIVRNPFERMVSAYAYLKRRLGVHESFYNFVMKRGRFAELLKHDSRTSITNILINIRPAAEYVCDTKGNVLVDFVGRFERLNSDWIRICRRLKRSSLRILPVKKRNWSTHRRYNLYYTDELREIVEKKFKKDIEIFKYAFQG